MQACGVSFTNARLLPMGSHPRVADRRATYDLFGPVSRLWSADYDRAMICAPLPELRARVIYSQIAQPHRIEYVEGLGCSIMRGGR